MGTSRREHLRFSTIGSSLILAGAVAGLASSASAAVIATKLDFESRKHGEPINTQYVSYAGITISGQNAVAGHPNLAIVFDSNKTGTYDPDEEFPWNGGNLTGVKEGKMLIIAQRGDDANRDGLIDIPDDEGHRPAGVMKFAFNSPQTTFGLDLIDVEGSVEYNSTSGFLSFRSGGKEVARVGWGAFVTPGNKFYDPTVVYGNNFANRIKPITNVQLGVSSFNEVWVNAGGSMAVDNLVWTNTPVPEPATAATFCLAGLAMHARRRRAGAA